MEYGTILAFILGSAWGSFFHTLGVRYLNGSLMENPVRSLFGRSKCPACGKAVTALKLIPVLGYFISRGRCGQCGEAISPAYPVSEAVHGLLAAALLQVHGPGPLAVSVYFAMACALTLSWIDLKSMIIPDFLNVGFLIFALYPALTLNGLKDSGGGFLLMFIFFLVILLLFPGSFGGGDLKLASVSGFFLGLEQAVVMLEISLIAGTLTGIAWALLTKKGFRSKIPFGPFLTAGLLTAHFFGRDILLIYYSWIL